MVPLFLLQARFRFCGAVVAELAEHQLEGQKPLSLQVLYHQYKPLNSFDFTWEHIGAGWLVLNGIDRKMVTRLLWRVYSEGEPLRPNEAKLSRRPRLPRLRGMRLAQPN